MKRWPLVEAAFAAAIIASIVYSLIYLYVNNYLPITFFYDPDDTFADWFNTAYWAYDGGSYDVWTTLYPPLSFVFLRLVTKSTCYPTRGFGIDGGFGLAARECDWASFVDIGGIFILNIVLVYLTLRKTDRASAVPRTIAVALGWPMLNALERGNLMLVTFTVFVLGFGPLLRRAWVKWICAGLAVNFKVYLIGAVLAPVLKRRWRWAECATLAVILVYMITYAVLGRGTLTEIVDNLQNWSTLPVATPLDMWSATTYQGLYSLLDSDLYPLAAIIGSRSVAVLHIAIPLLLRSTQSVILLAAAGIWLRPEVVPNYRAINLATMLALITSESGGYASAFFIFLAMMEPWRGFGRKLAIVLCYVLALPIDLPIDQIAPVVRDTYFGHSTTIVVAYVKLGPFIRPLVIDIVAVALSFVTIRDVWTDIRRQGWSARWRFRQDAPLLPWVSRPSPILPPAAATSPGHL